MADRPGNDAPYRLLDDVEFGEGVVVQSFANLYGCRIGDETRIGPFVEIQRGVELGDEVFVGHGVMFINDKRPFATNENGNLQTEADWSLLRTVVERRVSIGTGAVILGGVRIGEAAVIGAGAVVTRDVAPAETVIGSPAPAIALPRAS